MIDLTVKRLFFDRGAVMRAVGRATAKNMSRAGASIRKTAQRSMRYRRAPALPGQPPSAHKPRALLRRHLYYSYDRATRSVVIGPVKIGKTDAPERLEYGGRLRMVNPRRRKRRIGGSGEIKIGGSGPNVRRVRNMQGRKVRVTYVRLKTAGQVRRAERIQEQLFGPRLIRTRLAARPFMGPAFQKVRPEIPKMWADSVRAG